MTSIPPVNHTSPRRSLDALTKPAIGIDGLRVLDLAGLPAIYGTKLLSDLGADVVRLEPPGGDPLRQTPPFVADRPGPGRSLPYAFYNTGKRSLALDFGSSAGRQSVDALLGWADVVIQSDWTGEWAALGLDFASVGSTYPRLIWALVTPFGIDGPRSGWKANDLVALAAGGVLYLNGFPGSRPLQPPVQQAYHLGGIAAASGTLLALQARHRTGRGQFVDVSLQAAVATATENTLGYWDVEQRNRPRLGLHAFNGTTILHQCRDGWVAGMAGNRWEDMTSWAEEVGVVTDEWRDPALIARDDRAARMAQANRLVASLFITQPVAEVARRAELIRIPIQPANRIGDLFRDPQLAYRGFWNALAHPDLGMTITYPGAPFQSSSGFWRLRRRAPLPDEDSATVLADLAPRKPPATKSGGGDQPLAGIRVLDFSQAATGPLAGRILAEHGAEVIKIEWGQRPDPQRFFPPQTAGNNGPNVSALFNLVNAGKRSLTLNLNLPGGRTLLHRLVAISDVVLDNYGGDPFPKWGLTYPEARMIQPTIILARSSTTGRTGPRSGLAGLGYGIAAAAGWNELMGFPGEPPVGMGPAYPDYTVNCHHFLAAILTALEHRRRTGEGQYLDLSQHESTITWLGPAILDYTANGRVPEPNANRHPDFAPHGVYRAAGDDRWIAIAVEPATWPAFCSVTAQDGVRLDLERWGTHQQRKSDEDALDDILGSWTANHDPLALAVRLQAAGVAASNVATGHDLVDDPQLAHRSHFVRLTHPEAGDRLWDRPAFRLADTPGQPARSPLLGEDNDWVLETLLGLSPDEIAEAYVSGAVG